MERVLVLGCSGAGKSTFARALSVRTGLPLVSIDALFWRPGWREADRTDFAARMAAEADAPRWIMDGNYLGHGAGALRLARADTVFWFDLPTVTCLVGVMSRIIGSYGRVRPEMAAGCPERFDPAFLDYVRTFRARQRPKIASALAALRPDQRVVRFGRRPEAATVLARLEAPLAVEPA